MFDDAEVIHAYTRADALRDGVLIDVSATAMEAGSLQAAVVRVAAPPTAGLKQPSL
jgi:hypothetical protein